ncbi:glyoxylate/succinic semialdehyde reductase [Chloropicon roscoffensis]|uniref:Glyoxylate/succinic semialdehyde reductase n=1 Tax=Chloropicon roscoffensis TaxID=1461544 RepID=A0AAX4PGH5_9CHLO
MLLATPRATASPVHVHRPAFNVARSDSNRQTRGARQAERVRARSYRSSGARERRGKAKVAPRAAEAGEIKNSMGKVGFIGLGIMGKPMASNLLKAGFEVVVYNRTQAKCDELVKLGATAAKTPAEVVGACDTTVCMLADPKACLEVALGENGITSAIEAGKAVVDMSTVDAATSAQIYEAVKAKGGRFLEAPVSGSKKPAEDGALVILGAGDKDVYDESLPLFEVMGKKSVYLGDIGNGAKMKLVVNMMLGCMTTTFSEAIGLAEKSGLNRDEFFDVLGAGALQSPWYTIKGNAVKNELYGEHQVTFPMKHAQKDLRLALELGEQVNQSLTVAHETNELFKEAMAQGLQDCDLIAVHPVISKKEFNK